SKDPDEPVVISSADPLNLVGILTPGGRISPYSNQVVAYRKGTPVDVGLLGAVLSRLQTSDVQAGEESHFLTRSSQQCGNRELSWKFAFSEPELPSRIPCAVARRSWWTLGRRGSFSTAAALVCNRWHGCTSNRAASPTVS